ncbi:MAG: hypothetical protein HQ530_01150 [Parcubacteria group bacterium]|nr:hypothetical protein [Parcubacteria group bacterium]
MKITKKSLLFLGLFIILGLIAIQIPLVNIVGSAKKFTVLELFGPSVGMLAGPVIGPIAVLVVKIADSLIKSTPFEVVNLLLLLTMPLAAFYFGSKSKWRAVAPLVCFVLFVTHPVGREAWLYPLYWLIPIVGAFVFRKSLLVKSLGATFVAHAIGSTVYLYAFGLPAAVWLGLIPQVALERGFFAVGIWFSYLVMNNLLALVVKKFDLKFIERLVNDQYILLAKLK